jgi:hypothetical protein
MLLRVLIAIMIIGALVAGGIFIKDYYDETRAADSAQAQIDNTRNLAVTVSSQTKGVEADLANLAQQYSDAQQAVQAAQNLIPDAMDSNSIVKSVLVLARQTSVTVIPLKNQDWTKTKVNTDDYSVFKMTIEINGSESQIVDFVKKLQSNLYPTLVIEDLSFDKTFSTPEPTVTKTPTPTPTPVETVTANLSFAIYAK